MAETDEARLPRGGSFRAMLANMGWLLGGRVLAAVFSLAYLAILTRVLGPERFGVFALVVGMGQAVASLVQFQTWQIVVRYGMGHMRPGASAELTRLVKLCLALDAAAGLAGAVIGSAAILLLAPRFGWGGEEVRLAFLFTAVVLVTVRSTPAGIMRLFDRYGLSAIGESALTFARLAFTAAAAVLAPSIAGFVLAWALAEVAATALMWWGGLRAGRGLEWRATPLAPRRTMAENPGLLHFSAVTNASQSFTLAAKQLPVLVTGAHASNAAAGGYRLALQLANGFVKLSQLIARTLFPEMMRATTFAEDGRGLRRMVRRSSMGGALAALVMFAILALAGEPLLVLVAGEAYAGAFPLVLVVGTAAVIDFAGVGFEPGLYACGRERQVLWLRGMTAAAYVAAMLAAADRFGVMGAAYATLGYSAVSFVLLAAALRRAVAARPAR